MNRDDELFLDLNLEPDDEQIEANYWIERLHPELQDFSRSGRKRRPQRKGGFGDPWGEFDQMS